MLYTVYVTVHGTLHGTLITVLYNTLYTKLNTTMYNTMYNIHCTLYCTLYGIIHIIHNRACTSKHLAGLRFRPVLNLPPPTMLDLNQPLYKVHVLYNILINTSVLILYNNKLKQWKHQLCSEQDAIVGYSVKYFFIRKRITNRLFPD